MTGTKLRLEDLSNGQRVRLRVDIVPRRAGTLGTVLHVHTGGGGHAFPVVVKYDDGGTGNHQAHELELLEEEQ
jgi:hypothetical protein